MLVRLAVPSTRSQVSSGQTPTKRSTSTAGRPSSSAVVRLQDGAVEARHDRPARLRPRRQVGVLQRRIVAVLHHRIVAPGQALGEARLLGVVGQHAPERQVRLEPTRPPGRRSARSARLRVRQRPPRAGAGCRSGPRISKRSSSSAPRSVSTRRSGSTAQRPMRIVLYVLALPGPPQVEHLVGPEVQLVAQRLAVRARQVAGEGRRQPQPVRPDLRGAACASCGGLADLDHPDLDLGRRAPRSAPDSSCRRRRSACAPPTPAPVPSRCAPGSPPPGRNRFRTRTADCRDRGSSCARARPPARRRRSRPRAPPRTPPRAAARFARGSSPCR